METALSEWVVWVVWLLGSKRERESMSAARHRDWHALTITRTTHHTQGTKWNKYERDNFVSWEDASFRCSVMGLELPSYTAYCPSINGVTSSMANILDHNEVWVPYRGTTNANYVRMDNNAICQDHSLPPPSWSAYGGFPTNVPTYWRCGSMSLPISLSLSPSLNNKK